MSISISCSWLRPTIDTLASSDATSACECECEWTAVRRASVRHPCATSVQAKIGPHAVAVEAVVATTIKKEMPQTLCCTPSGVQKRIGGSRVV